MHASLHVSAKDILLDNLNYYKGFLVENFVACELKSMLNDDLITWEEGNAEIEFIVETQHGIVPIEVKSSKKYRRSKSLDSFIARYHPERAYKLSMENYYTSHR